MKRLILARLAALVTALAACVALGSLSPAQADAHGANDSCDNGGHIYCPTPQGESQNGNGQGNAVGRPDAGTVGNADAKNPPGQEQTDPKGVGNKGYECDDNNGIAKGNPAHTGCEDTSYSS